MLHKLQPHSVHSQTHPHVHLHKVKHCGRMYSLYNEGTLPLLYNYPVTDILYPPVYYVEVVAVGDCPDDLGEVVT